MCICNILFVYILLPWKTLPNTYLYQGTQEMPTALSYTEKKRQNRALGPEPFRYPVAQGLSSRNLYFSFYGFVIDVALILLHVSTILQQLETDFSYANLFLFSLLYVFCSLMTLVCHDPHGANTTPRLFSKQSSSFSSHN